jgi:hypothetical protein
MRDDMMKKERYEKFMWMRSPSQALDEIALLILMQAPLKDQDAWLKACVKLGYVELEDSYTAIA